MASFKAKFPVLQELFAKNHRGGAGRGLRFFAKSLSNDFFRFLVVARSSFLTIANFA